MSVTPRGEALSRGMSCSACAPRRRSDATEKAAAYRRKGSSRRGHFARESCSSMRVCRPSGGTGAQRVAAARGIELLFPFNPERPSMQARRPATSSQSSSLTCTHGNQDEKSFMFASDSLGRGVAPFSALVLTAPPPHHASRQKTLPARPPDSPPRQPDRLFCQLEQRKSGQAQQLYSKRRGREIGKRGRRHGTVRVQASVRIREFARAVGGDSGTATSPTQADRKV
jgi:hypothetical protein